MANSDTRQIVPPPTPMKITQIAVVVRDMKAALKSYTETMGWGPWSVFDYKPPLLHDTRVHGEAVELSCVFHARWHEMRSCDALAKPATRSREASPPPRT